MKIDLSAFRQNYVKDTIEDMMEIAAIRQSQPIPEGIYEVVVSSIHEKDGVKVKNIDKLGGAIGFSLVVKDAQKREQMIYISIPMAVTFKQACTDLDRKVSFQFTQSIKNLQAMKIDPVILREALITTDGDAVECLVGTQFVIENTWDVRKLHLEYDSTSKAHYFVTSSRERFTEGEMAAPISLDSSKKDDSKFAEAIGIAHSHSYQLATRMNVRVESHPTASNEHINKELSNKVQPKKPIVQTVLNKTVPTSFPTTIKKMSAPLSIDQEFDLEG